MVLSSFDRQSDKNAAKSLCGDSNLFFGNYNMIGQKPPA